jgi:hypothetical protein
MSAKDIDALLKENVLKPGSEFRNKLESRLSMTEFKRVQDATMFVDDEEITINGVKRIVKRLFVRDEGRQVTGVGWIINEDITACMVCGLGFGIFRWPHHCRSCGNLVCNPCSPNLVAIVGMEDLGEVRACVQCYWGQYPVYPVYQRKDDDDEDGSIDYSNNGDGINAFTSMGVLTPASSPMKTGDNDSFFPEPVFAVYFVRTFQELEQQVSGASKSVQHDRTVYVNICKHLSMVSLPEEKEYVICDNVFLAEDQAEDLSLEDKDRLKSGTTVHVAEIYHAILRPDLVDEVLLDDNVEQYMQVL